MRRNLQKCDEIINFLSDYDESLFCVEIASVGNASLEITASVWVKNIF